MATYKPIRLFSGASGLVNNVSSVRLKFIPESGIAELSEAVDVVYDRTGRVMRRNGYKATAVTGSIHSLFVSGDVCVYVKSGSLYRLFTDYSSELLTSGLESGAKMSYAPVNNIIYYVNGYQVGSVANGKYQAWSAGTWTGPTTTRVVSGPPVGHLVMYHYGRIFVAVDNIVYYSNPFALSMFPLASNFLAFSGRVTMLRPVHGKDVYGTDGFYVGVHGSGVFYIGGGEEPKKYMQQIISTSDVIEGTDVNVGSVYVGKGEHGLSAIWTATDGIWVGQHSGKAENVTRDAIEFPKFSRGTGVFFNRNYITLMEG